MTCRWQQNTFVAGNPKEEEEEAAREAGEEEKKKKRTKKKKRGDMGVTSSDSFLYGSM